MEKLSIYHEQCVNAITKLMENGEKRITSIIPAGAGMSNVLVELAKNQMEKGKRVAILAGNNNRLKLLEMKLMNYGICYIDLRYRIEQLRCISLSLDDAFKQECGFCFASNEMISQYDVVLLYEMTPFLRYRLKNVYNGDKKTTIVSFSASPFDANTEKIDEITKSMLAMGGAMLKSGNLEPIVFATGNMFDICDIYGACAEEQEIILRNVRSERNRLAHSISTIAREKEVLCSRDLKVDELEKQLEVLKRKVEFQEILLAAVGISKKEVEEAFDQIESLRDSMKNDLYDTNGKINESIMAMFETKVANVILELTKSVLTIQTKDYYEKILVGFLGKCVWEERLCDESKSNLIAARMNYDAMMQMEDKERLDFSGVCLLLTKTLDIEMSRRFYLDYIKWLQRKYVLPGQISKWPNSLLNKEKTDILPNCDFTLGTVAWVLGIDGEGNVKNTYVNRMIKKYSREQLYSKDISDIEIEQKLKEIAICTEKVRNDYRNPSAHREHMHAIDAENCMEYMIETYEKIKKILGEMLY